jgi:hypothetical protein
MEELRLSTVLSNYEVHAAIVIIIAETGSTLFSIHLEAALRA